MAFRHYEFRVTGRYNFVLLKILNLSYEFLADQIHRVSCKGCVFAEGFAPELEAVCGGRVRGGGVADRAIR